MAALDGTFRCRNRGCATASGTPSRDIATRCGSGQWIKAFALSRGTRAKTDRIDAELIARFMACRPRAGRERPDENLARKKQGIAAGVESMNDDLKDLLDTRIVGIERRIESVIGRVEPLAAKANLP